MRTNKRDELVGKATAIFYAHGFQATGMDLLVAQTGISKTSIYKHFETKDDLIVAALKLRDEQIRGWLIGRVRELAAAPRDQLVAIFDALDEWFAQPDFHGCMFAKACSEFQDPQHPINREARDHVARLAAQIEAIAAQAGLPQPGAVAQRLTLLKEGAVALAMLGQGGRPALVARGIAAAIVAGADAGPGH